MKQKIEESFLRVSEDELEISKVDQSFIHIVHNITDLQYKVWYLFIEMITTQEGNHINEDRSFNVSKNSIEKKIGYELTNKKWTEILEGLRTKSVKLNFLNKNKEEVIKGMGFISEYEITSNRVSITFPYFIYSRIFNENNGRMLYLLLDWKILNSFSSKYSTILYKHAKDYAGVGRTPTLTIEDFRSYIGLSATEYSITSNLIQFCINKPLAEINSSNSSDITIKVNYIMKGKRKIGIWFSVTPKRSASQRVIKSISEDSIVGRCLSEEELSCFKDMRYEITEKKKLDYLEIYSISQIKLSIEAANEYINKLLKNNQEVNYGGIYKIGRAHV